jgi:hypothetical protein
VCRGTYPIPSHPFDSPDWFILAIADSRTSSDSFTQTFTG